MRNRTYVRNKKAPVFASSCHHGSKSAQNPRICLRTILKWYLLDFRTVPWICEPRKSPTSRLKLRKGQIQILHEAAFWLDNPGNSPHTKITCFFWWEPLVMTHTVWVIPSTYPLPLVQKWNWFCSIKSENHKGCSKTQIDIEYIWANRVTEINL